MYYKIFCVDEVFVNKLWYDKIRTIRAFQIFSKICGDIRGSRCTTGVVDTSGKWKKSSS
jgi:hypothetical protein